MTVGIYVRVSTEEQVAEGYSISAQREKMKAYCKVQDWNEYKFYVDEGISAKDTNRPQLKQMLQHIEEGHIDTVLVYRLDRLTRSVVDLYKLLDVFEKYDCTFKSATEVYDTGSAIGRLFITLVAAMAQWERENLGERVRMGQTEKARQGQFSAAAPFGFRKVDSKLVIHDEEKEIMLDIINRAKKGSTARQLSTYMNNSGHSPIRGYQWHIGTILSLLRNPALYGATKWRDQIIEDTHEGIISKEEFMHLRSIIESRRHVKLRETKSVFIFQTKIICPVCGGRFTSERSRYTRKTDKQTIEHASYRCGACPLNGRKSPSMSQTKIHKAFVEYMRNFATRTAPKPLGANRKKDIKKILNKLTQVEKQREKYQRGWSMELMTDEEFSDRMIETKEVMDELQEELNKIEPVEEVMDKEKAKMIVRDFNNIWSRLEDLEKKEFMSQFVESISFEKENGVVEVKDVRFF
ncbi:recombinase family protein [Salipaludibacillus sp. CF4.18]|uniref:recombinase family protein n=1 Tax=Salipaludibacillus sp. CF4.18 TaxID=3373081 RepID=UPI003EE77C2A